MSYGFLPTFEEWEHAQKRIKQLEADLQRARRLRRADNNVFYQLFTDHHITGLSLSDVQAMREKEAEKQ